MAVALAERLRKAAAPWEPAGNDTHYLAIAREALAFAREQLPTREQLAGILYDNFSEARTPGSWDERVKEDPEDQDGDRAPFLFQADAILRDLRARLGENG
jgi:hypothetical protein